MNTGATWAIAAGQTIMMDKLPVTFMVDPADASHVHLVVSRSNGSHTDYRFNHNGLFVEQVEVPAPSVPTAAAAPAEHVQPAAHHASTTPRRK